MRSHANEESVLNISNASGEWSQIEGVTAPINNGISMYRKREGIVGHVTLLA
jgi:hypothetical protein